MKVNVHVEENVLLLNVRFLLYHATDKKIRFILHVSVEHQSTLNK